MKNIKNQDYTTMSEHNIQISVKLAVPEPPFHEVFYQFQQAARDLIDGQFSDPSKCHSKHVNDMILMNVHSISFFIIFICYYIYQIIVQLGLGLS